LDLGLLYYKYRKKYRKKKKNKEGKKKKEKKRIEIVNKALFERRNF